MQEKFPFPAEEPNAWLDTPGDVQHHTAGTRWSQCVKTNLFKAHLNPVLIPLLGLCEWGLGRGKTRELECMVGPHKGGKELMARLADYV